MQARENDKEWKMSSKLHEIEIIKRNNCTQSANASQIFRWEVILWSVCCNNSQKIENLTLFFKSLFLNVLSNFNRKNKLKNIQKYDKRCVFWLYMTGLCHIIVIIKINNTEDFTILLPSTWIQTFPLLRIHRLPVLRHIRPMFISSRRNFLCRCF